MPRAVIVLGRVILTLLAALAVVYGGDYVSLKFQIPERPRTRDIQIHSLVAVPEKDGKLEYIAGDAEVRTCSTSLFPQLGYSPCWWVTRHEEQIIQM